jgi:septum site-determining protein MinC
VDDLDDENCQAALFVESLVRERLWVFNIQENKLENGTAVLLDISMAGNSAQACQLADEFVAGLIEIPANLLVDINAGDLLLTRGVLTKLKQQILRAGAMMGTMYTTVPQTQQAALDEGLFVKEKLLGEWSPMRQPLPMSPLPLNKEAGSRSPGRSAMSSAGGEPARRPAPLSPETGAQLPDFSHPKPTPSQMPEPVSPKPESLQAESFVPLAHQLDQPVLPDHDPDIEDTETLIESVTYETSQTEGFIPFRQESDAQTDLTQTATDTLYLRQTLRSGQTVRYKGHIIIVGDAHAGSEITAGGDIVVWGELRGIAHAGAFGNYKAEIRAMKIEALQLRIADYIARRPDRIYYHKDAADHLHSPEVARVADAEIKIFKTLFPKG